MHELSLCEAIADTVVRRAAGRPVTRATVRIGAMRQVVPDSMSFCWTMLTDGSELDGCALDIEHIDAVIACVCGARTTLRQPILVCDSCGSVDVVLETGEELLLVSIDLAREQTV